MKRTMPLLSVFALLPVLAFAQGQVYKTTDAEGNTVFTDVPPTENAERVDLETTNIADSVEVRPPEEPAAPSAPAAAEPAPAEMQRYQATSDDLREDLGEAKRKQEMRDRVGDAVGAPERPPTAQPLPAPAQPRPSPGR